MEFIGLRYYHSHTEEGHGEYRIVENFNRASEGSISDVVSSRAENGTTEHGTAAENGEEQNEIGFNPDSITGNEISEQGEDRQNDDTDESTEEVENNGGDREEGLHVN